MPTGTPRPIHRHWLLAALLIAPAILAAPEDAPGIGAAAIMAAPEDDPGAGAACVQGLPAEALAQVPERLRTFRFPFGTCNPGALDLLAAHGLPAVQWDVLTGDPSPKTSAARIASIIRKQVRPGSIIIGHANGRGWHTAEALDRFIPALREQGYRFVTVSELLAASTPAVVAQCYWERPGDADYIDRVYGGGTEKPWPFH